MNRRMIAILTSLLLLCLACGVSSGSSGLKDYGPADELQADYWFHVTKPLNLRILSGKVILVDVWQFT
jgi:hypothetical protein